MEINKKTRQDFLDREWVKKLMDAGVDMSDSKYFIVGNWAPNNSREFRDFVKLKADHPEWNNPEIFDNPVPTYTLSEILLKLNEWPYKEGIKMSSRSSYGDDCTEPENSGGLTFFKDAPFYCFFYKNWGESQCNISEYPLHAAASLLLWCMNNGVGCVEDISDK